MPSSQSSGTRQTPPAHSERAQPSVPLLIGAGALIVFGLSRHSVLGKLLAAGGAALAWQGIQTGPAPQFKTRARVRIGTSADAAYKLWSDLPRIPEWQLNIDKVEVLDAKHSRWTMNGPGDTPLSWTSEITDDQPGKRIAWQTTPGSAIQTRGSVEFAEDPLGRGLFVTSYSTFNIPSGPLTRFALSVLGRNPDFISRESLRHFKSLLEAGEVPTVLGQSHGPRGLSGKLTADAFRETSNWAEPQAPGAPNPEQQPEYQPA